MATRLDGVGDKVAGFLARTWRDVKEDVGETLAEKGRLGVAEIQRALWPESNVALQPATSQQQLLSNYEQKLQEAHDRAAAQPPETDRGIGK